MTSPDKTLPKALADTLLESAAALPFAELGRRLGVVSLIIAHGGHPAQAASALTALPLPSGTSPAQWRALREEELRRLVELPVDALFPLACEALHDITRLLSDLRYQGVATWDRYPVPRLEVGWWYKSLLSIFYARMSGEKYQAFLAEYAARVRSLNEIVFEGGSPQ